MKILEIIDAALNATDPVDFTETLHEIRAAYQEENRDKAIQAARDRNDMEEAARLMNGGDL